MNQEEKNGQDYCANCGPGEICVECQAPYTDCVKVENSFYRCTPGPNYSVVTQKWGQ